MGIMWGIHRFLAHILPIFFLSRTKKPAPENEVEMDEHLLSQNWSKQHEVLLRLICKYIQVHFCVYLGRETYRSVQRDISRNLGRDLLFFRGL